jgi:RNA polymerase sigma-70 factor (ECF subfamily)
VLGLARLTQRALRTQSGRRSLPTRCPWQPCCCSSGLTPLERAVFVLRKVFGFGFPESASAVGRSEAAFRQLAVRARRHMDIERPRFETDRRACEELAERFFEAFWEGHVDRLWALLAADDQMVGDGGGKPLRLPRA